MYWYFGKPNKVEGFSANQGGLYDAQDFASLCVQFENDIQLQGTWSFNVHRNSEKETCEILGEKGKLKFSFFRNPVLEVQTDNYIEKFEFPIPEHIQQPMIEQVAKHFKGEDVNPCSLDDALESMKMIDATKEV
jgi:predicted dehydrogenase